MTPSRHEKTVAAFFKEIKTPPVIFAQKQGSIFSFFSVN
jgi:hypothetical protein